MKNLFNYTEQFKPQDIHIGTSLKPFYPDYIPALGYVDEFIKVPRPNGEFDGLGLKVNKLFHTIMKSFQKYCHDFNIKLFILIWD